VASSRNEIDKILTRWGADQLQWSQDNKGGLSMLRFIWEYGGTSYCARFEVKVPSAEEIEEASVDGRNGCFSQAKFDRAMKRRGMVEHRELALLLKALFVAVDSGLIKAEQILLPFLEDSSGQTVADLVLPHMAQIQKRGGIKLLLARGA
jgi:hypothetical protein